MVFGDWRQSCKGLTVLALAAMLGAVGVQSAPLGKEACDLLKVERDQLEAAGLVSEMMRGPEWARTNLPAERLLKVLRLIEVGEQITFRCPQPKPAVADDKPAPAEQGQPKRRAKKPADSDGISIIEALGASDEPAKPKAAPVKPKTPAKPKASDAYIPPPAKPVSERAAAPASVKKEKTVAPSAQ